MAAKPSTAARKPTNNALRLRILLGEAIAVGPGKADLLAAIAAEGSISAAARTMGMSYRRAWLLVDELNRVFVGPVVVSETGGRRGGGAVLTALGQDILRRYRAMEQRAAASVADDIRAFRALLHEKANY